MNTPSHERPASNEYDAYYDRYVRLVPETEILAAMAKQITDTLAHLRGLAPGDGAKRYAPGKWSITEVVGHMCDTERVFAQRALFFSRNVPGPLPGMEQDDWVKAGPFGSIELADMINEFESVRASTVWLFHNLTPDAWSRKGIASQREFTVRALAFIIVGHERHHLGILRTRYT